LVDLASSEEVGAALLGDGDGSAALTIDIPNMVDITATKTSLRQRSANRTDISPPTNHQYSTKQQ
jgi:hypothetical protein